MPDPTDEELAPIIEILRNLDEELATRRGDDGGRTQTVALGTEQGRLSRMDAMQQQQMALAEKAMLERRLDAVRRALSRVDDGSFGYCTRCDEPIALRRLRVVPESPLCMACLRSLGG
ncbi:MAG: TraR/DksA family transcriptional regulator [Deltaproteobacteria bacterium]|nr:MAG: TraR/DksA family transcriptional regulator [Deltaproteobacteria bacterium]